MKPKTKEGQEKWAKEFRFYYSAPLVDLSNKEKPTLGDINGILVKQIAFICSLLKSQKECPQNKREDIIWRKGYADGFEVALHSVNQMIDDKLGKKNET